MLGLDQIVPTQADNEQFIVWGAIGLVLFTAVYLLSRIVTPWFFKSYRSLSTEDKRNWDDRYISNLHALSLLYLASKYVIFDEYFWKQGEVPVTLRTNGESYICMGISCSYFIVDFLVCAFHPSFGGFAILAHHVGSIITLVYAWHDRQGHFQIMFSMLMELTTPFINARWFLDKMGLKQSPLFVANGLVLILTWVVGRLYIFYPFYSTVFSLRHEWQLMSWRMGSILAIMPVVLLILNVIWFSKILRGALKVLGIGRAKSGKDLHKME
mmetsp:Transcript_14925/g.32345  ORF Transcript_14925/g.32345 Transcript_14925/m.32345 type:complete len:269 (+) Transcript_14925:270-1076(+)